MPADTEFSHTPSQLRGGFLTWVRHCFQKNAREAGPPEYARNGLYADWCLRCAPPARPEPITSPLRTIKIHLRLSSLDDARFVLHGLRLGQTQVINLASAVPDEADRILDFMTGAAEALDAEIEPLGPAVYLMCPVGVSVEMDFAPDPIAAEKILRLPSHHSPAATMPREPLFR